MRRKTNKPKIISGLRQKLEIYAQNRLALLDDLANLNDDQLRRKPGPGEWSILQIVQHDQVFLSAFNQQGIPGQ